MSPLSIAHRALRGRAVARLARVIPNPVLRYAAVTVATALVPAVLAAIAKRSGRR